MIAAPPTPRHHRRVRHLRLACREPAHATRARTLLEDALRTASIDDAGRLLLVRRLDLGSVPLRASATAWSQRIEQRLASVHTDIVSVHSPSASAAAAVYFSSPAEPWLLIAERAALALPSTEWFWPLALPGWRPTQPASATLLQAFRTLASRPDALPLTLHLAHRLAARDALPALLAVLTPDLPPLPRAAGPLPLPQPRPAAAQPSSPRDASSPPPPPPAPPALARYALTWGPEDPRTLWLATVLARQPRIHSAPTPSAPPATHEFLSPPSSQSIAAARDSLFSPPPRPSPSPLPSTPTAPPPTGPAAATPSRAPRPATPPHSPPPDRRPTAAGGLLFLLPLLARAGLPAHLDTLPAETRARYLAHLFHLALRHARIPADDPFHELFPPSPLSSTRSPAHFLLTAARLSRRLALPLRSLIRRPALLTVTPTHLDLFFRPGEAELAIRRATLDLDPGWLPWLGLVVHFHYTRED